MPIEDVKAGVAETTRGRATARIEAAVKNGPPGPAPPLSAIAPLTRSQDGCRPMLSPSVMPSLFHRRHYRDPRGYRASPMRHNPRRGRGIFLSRERSLSNAYEAVTSRATNSLTGIAANAARSANMALMDSVCLGLKCAATLASNFFTSTGIPSSRRLRWPMG